MITASTLERVAACPASAALPQVNSTSVYAERGTGIHEFLAHKDIARVPEEFRAVCEAIDLDSLPTTLMPEAAFIFDTTTGKARFLGSNIGRAYGALKWHEIAGTADVIGIDGDKGYVADYFTGFLEMRKGAQLRFLALCLARVHGLSEVVTEAIKIRPDGSVWRETETLDALDLDAVALELAETAVQVDKVRARILDGEAPSVAEGQHCRWCPAALHCPAKTGLLKIAASGGDVAAPFLTGGLSAGQVGSAWVMAEQLDALAKELKRRCHGALDEFGEAPTPRGTVLRKVISPGNERIDGASAAKLLAEMFGPDAVKACAEIDVTKKSLGAGLRLLHGKAGAANERTFLDRLRAVGGVTRKPSEKIEEVSINERLSNG